MISSKEVFNLRRQGKLDEAIHMARTLFQKEPDDEWNIKAYGWVVYSIIMKNKDSNDVTRYINELKKLPAIEDSLFNEKRDFAYSITNPINQKLQRLKQKSKNGDHSGALLGVKNLRIENGGSEQIDEFYGWELWHSIKMQLYDDDPNSTNVSNMFKKYARLMNSKPSLLHSRMLDIASRAAKKDCFSNFFGFFMWWNQKNIRDEDYISNNKDGIVYESTVERVIKALGHICKKENDKQKLEYASNFIEKNYLKFPENEWFPYYLSLVWNKIGRNPEALGLLIPIVRKKSSEYWAWQHLSECYQSGSIEKLQTLCKSLTCYVKSPEFLLNVRLELADELIKNRYLNEAKYQIMKIKSIREEREWGIKGKLEEMLSLEWLTDVEENKGSDLIKSKAKDAEYLLMKDLPELKGVVAVPQLRIKNKKNKLAIIDYRDNLNNLQSISISHHRFPDIKNYQKGEPIEIIIDMNEERPNVLRINHRTGKKWDINSSSTGIVIQINDKKKLSMIKFSDGDEAFLYHNETDNATSFQVGDFVACKISKDRKRTKVREIKIHDENIESIYWKEFEGNFVEKDGGGGHVGNIFIPTYLSKRINHSEYIQGMAIKKEGTSGSNDWWLAIII
ncbi:MAG: hypothetical protein CMG55_05025 [Candidatus Marinimicrobia bacterium]|nr:hypothetical protein [Candidatus Neomarinimicrobiota bacterium]